MLPWYGKSATHSILSLAFHTAFARHQAGKATTATKPSAATRVTQLVVHALCQAAASVHWGSEEPTAKLVCILFLFCYPDAPFMVIKFQSEGLSLNFKFTSSLVKVQEYQNATIFLDLFDNAIFSSYKACPIVSLISS